MPASMRGPFQYHAVFVDGERVPMLTAAPAENGAVVLSATDSYCIELPEADWQRVASFVAFCIKQASTTTVSCSPAG